VAVAGTIAAAIAVASRDRGAKPAPLAAKPPDVKTLIDAGEMAPVAVVRDAPDAQVTFDAAPVVHRLVKQPVTSDVAQHLAAAENAKRAGNYLPQIIEAKAVLRTDPHNVRARFLVADGLITSGDLDNGCKWLRDLGKNPTAQARAREAGCPGR
jgi:hypothetical protein